MTPDEIRQRLNRLFRYMGVNSCRAGCAVIGFTEQAASRWVNGRAKPSKVVIRLIEKYEKQYIPASEEKPV